MEKMRRNEHKAIQTVLSRDLKDNSVPPVRFKFNTTVRCGFAGRGLPDLQSWKD
jgi:hypothetical protein